MIKIRLARSGNKNKPFYRIIATDERKKRSTGTSLETLGFWHPMSEKTTIDTDKIKEWVAKGAVVSPAVKKLIETKKK